jgi:hypothetical protein
MPAPACNAPIAPTLTIRARGVECGDDVHRIHALPGLRIAVDDLLERKAAGDVDERIEPAEMRRRGVDRLFCLGRIGQIDAAEFDPIWRRWNLGRRVVDGRDPRAACQRLVSDHRSERAQRAGDDNDFSVHDGSPHAPGSGGAHYRQENFICNGGTFAAR